MIVKMDDISPPLLLLLVLLVVVRWLRGCLWTRNARYP